MDRGLEKERFVTFKLKSSAAKRFRRFSKSFGKSQSMTLLTMLDFFECNEVSPDERLGETVSSLKHQMKRRFNAVIAIIRDIEKNQTRPTTAMLQKLFEEAANQEEEEDYDFGTPQLMETSEELKHFQEGYYKWKKNFQDVKIEMGQLFDKVEYVKNPFGKGYWKLNMSKDELEQIKKGMDHVHYDNPSETRR